MQKGRSWKLELVGRDMNPASGGKRDVMAGRKKDDEWATIHCKNMPLGHDVLV